MRISVVTVAMLVALIAIGAAVAGCSSEGDGDAAPAAAADTSGGEAADAPTGDAAPAPSLSQEVDVSITFTSSVFNEKKRIPKKHTCTKLSANVPNISPPIMWEGVPAEAVTLALIMDSQELPDNEEQVHWVMWNMPPDTTELTENVPNTETLDNGAVQGTNGDGTIGYYGPCPPPIVPIAFDTAGGANLRHQKQQAIQTYTFRLYALDTTIDLPAGSTKADLIAAMEGHVLAAGELVGERQGKTILKE